MAERTVKVRLHLDVAKYVQGGERAQKSTRDFRAELADAARQGDQTAMANGRAARAMAAAGRAAGRAGGGFSEAARDAQRLQRNIDEVSDELKELIRQFLRTGDVELLAKVDQGRGVLAHLQRMRRELVGVRSDASSAMDVLGQLPSQLRGGLIVGLGGAAALAAPLLGGIISAAVIGGVGAGGIVGGIVAASRHKAVQDAAGELVDRLEEPFSVMGAAFVEPVIESLDSFGDTGVKIMRELRPELRALAPLVVDLAEGIAGMAERATPGIAETLREARPVLKALSEELPGLGEALGDMLAMIAGGGDDAIAAMRTLFTLTEMTMGTVGMLTRGLTETFGVFKDVSGTPVLGWMTGFSGVIVDMAQKTDEAAASGDSFATTIGDQLKGVLEDGAAAGGEFARAQIEASESMYHAALAAGDLHAALMILNGGQLAVREAERQFEAAIDAVTESIEENGRTLDRNTEAGRANEETLDAIAGRAMTLASAIYEETGSQQAATEAIEAGRESLIEAAEQMGLNEGKARDLADEILGIPEDWETTFRTNAERVQDRVDDFDAAIRRVPFFKRTTFETNADRVRAGVEAIQRAIDRLSGKTVNVHTNYTSSGGGGGNYAERWGGILHAQIGRLIPAHITSSPTVLYGERATGREAYVPMRGDAARSTRILSEAASWYGMQLSRADYGTPYRGSSGWAMPSTEVSASVDESRLTRSLVRAFDGARLVIDDRGNGRLVALQAGYYERAG